jgi:hypothetical protein
MGVRGGPVTLNGTEDAAAVAVIGRDAVATGSAAIELARAEARHRAVTIVDLIGDAPPLRRAVQTDDDHGVADCFAYGVSFGAVSRPTTADPHVSIITSGSEPLAYPETLGSRRWEHLIAQTRERGDLIVFAALAGTPGLDALISRIDFVIPEGLVLRTPPVVVPAATAPAAVPARPRGPRVLHSSPPRISRRQALSIAAALVVVLGAAGTAWAVRRSTAAPSLATGVGAGQRRDTLTSTAQLGVTERASGDVPTGPLAAPVDPEDSAVASAFAVRVGTYPTYQGALRALRQEIKRGAATITPLPPSGVATSSAGGTGQLFALYVGAAPAAATLDSAIHIWSMTGGFAGGAVTHTPYALRLTGRITPDSARRATIAFRSRGVPAYALDAADGRAAVYAGAFVSIDQAGPLATSLRNVGLASVLAYRVGQAP